MDHEMPPRLWTTLAEGKLDRLMALMHPVAVHSDFTKQQRRSLGWLSTACFRSSASALLLIANDQVWDAEVVSMVSFEGSLKFCHLLSDRNRFAERHREYTSDLPAISALADHAKASRLLEAAPPEDHAMLRPFRDLLLSDKELQQVSQRYPSDVRRRLSGAWGLTGIVEHMTRTGEGMGKLAGGLLHGYAMASHVAHVDALGIGMMMEREHREASKRDSANRAHAARVVSDQVWLNAMRLFEGYRFVGADPAPVHAIVSFDDDLWRSLSGAQSAWHAQEYGA